MADEVRRLEGNRETARRLIDEAYGQKKLDLVDELVTDDYFDHRSGVQGAEALKEYIAGLKEMASDHTVSSDLQLAHDEYVAVRWTATGTNDGPLMGGEPTGKSFEYTGMNLYRMEGERIAECWTYWDSAQMAEQLGSPA
jgi:predicted ester cyclase